MASHGEVLKHRPCCGQYGKVHLFYSGEHVADDGTAQCVDDRWHAGWCHVPPFTPGTSPPQRW